MGLPMLIVRILLVLLALASPAFAEDGLIDAAAARDAAQAFRVYVEGVTKKGERPDLTRPEVTALLGRVFNLDGLNALPPAQGSDLPWLLDWMEAANATNKLFTRYGSKPGPQPDLAAIQRNMTEAQCAVCGRAKLLRMHSLQTGQDLRVAVGGGRALQLSPDRMGDEATSRGDRTRAGEPDQRDPAVGGRPSDALILLCKLCGAGAHPGPCHSHQCPRQTQPLQMGEMRRQPRT